MTTSPTAAGRFQTTSVKWPSTIADTATPTAAYAHFAGADE